MTTCCARLSKVYMITTNLLFACLGVAFIALGVIGMKDGFSGATLFPNNIFKYLAILGGVICVAAIVGIIGAYIRKSVVTYIYMIIIIGALVFQVIIGIRIYQAAANAAKYLSDIWPTASASYRLNLQNQFYCCGYQTIMDGVVASDTCQPTSSLTSNLPPCAPALQGFVKSTFGKVYLAVFAALALELLAMSNAITLLCTGSHTDQDEEDERRKRRKSGIRLDDMTVDTPTTLVGQEEPKYFAYGTEDVNRNNRYDSYDMYRHNNNSNHYSDNYNGNTITNNRHGNGNGGAYY
ncbi:acyl-CoA-binding protein (ACBP)/diazepam binding inhibitor (DBI)/endozepine (EP) [Mucor velutinosus]|uniref:Acyl-CoA-binding protein (ACBP)/diazepam binding inhibitor (DBI)/endozepine (EP) n=1 Tax=Mucor velutinosus TaxID=708070 RepID=A0AAN7DM61_9FUNG|nr:acyl-CoA-binding protein (ACBP)/diazepam binding inhibitor (DBI)/endozepine (EP) [Mucor velutinosus]